MEGQCGHYRGTREPPAWGGPSTNHTPIGGSRSSTRPAATNFLAASSRAVTAGRLARHAAHAGVGDVGRGTPGPLFSASREVAGRRLHLVLGRVVRDGLDLLDRGLERARASSGMSSGVPTSLSLSARSLASAMASSSEIFSPASEACWIRSRNVPQNSSTEAFVGGPPAEPPSSAAVDESLLPQPTRSPRTRNRAAISGVRFMGSSLARWCHTRARNPGWRQPEAGLRRTPGERRRPRLPGARARYSRRDTCTTPRDARCGVCHCTSSSRGSAGAVAEQLDQPHQGDLRGVGLAVEHRLAGEQAADRRRRTARRPAARRTRPPPSAPSRGGAARRYAARIAGSIQPAGRRGVGAGVDDLGDGRVDPDLEPAHRPPQRPRDPQAVQRQHPAAYRARTTASGRRAGPRAWGTARAGRPPAASPARGPHRRPPGRRRGRTAPVPGTASRSSAARLAWPPRRRSAAVPTVTCVSAQRSGVRDYAATPPPYDRAHGCEAAWWASSWHRASPTWRRG